MSSSFRTHGRRWVQSWEAAAVKHEGQPLTIDLLSDVLETTLNVIGSAAFGSSLDELSDKGSSVLRSFRQLLNPESVTDQVILPVALFVIPDPVRQWLPLSLLQRRFRKSASIRLQVVEIIQRRRKDPSTRNDLLGRLLASATGTATDPAVLSDADLVDHSMTFLAAGHATTSILVSWVIVMLALRPRLLRALQDEMTEAFPEGRKSAESLAKLNELPLLDAVIKETLRLYPPFSCLARHGIEADRIGDYDTRPGALVTLPIAAIHRNPKYWGADAGTFRPSRWLNKEVDDRDLTLRFIPFLYGSRGCIGARFAHYEAKVLLQEYLWSAVTVKVRPGCEISDGGPAGILNPKVETELHPRTPVARKLSFSNSAG
eukprot:Plantae.Rhodophyta-Rhodochaete_pulchella.ctg6124.p1 GENE.Plantae.Rhodophyta-Rhodochaete_pulchella.ctg6124~~Plantae.Rhodophyta-Rhodochaete_pulchella.ctg6124.p1  ORF type:complete len:374 (+),score=33.40 Plantae.Rhodophyta-Rhodochaete_pulchella.ctg6124:189-1310(+)